MLRVWEKGEFSEEELERRCGSPDHQGIVAEAEPYPYVDAAELLAPDDALVVALDQVQDPQNVGAICRSAEGAGAEGVDSGAGRAQGGGAGGTGDGDAGCAWG